MNWRIIDRIAAIMIGAAVVFVLQHQLGYSLYVAIPAGIIAYTIVRLAFALLMPKA